MLRLSWGSNPSCGANKIRQLRAETTEQRRGLGFGVVTVTKVGRAVVVRVRLRGLAMLDLEIRDSRSPRWRCS